MGDKTLEALAVRFWSSAPDNAALVLQLCNRKDKNGLRGASTDCRTATNASVVTVIISEEGDLKHLVQLRLHERFPNLANLVLQDGMGGSRRVVRSITSFADVTLSRLRRLESVDLSKCKELDIASAARALLASCPRLQELIMPQGGRVSNATLQLLAQLSSLAFLQLDRCRGFDAAGLQHLSNLQELRNLQCTRCPDIMDEEIAALAHVQALTSLGLMSPWCSSNEEGGKTLGHLTRLIRLQQLSLPLVGAQQLAAVGGVTSLRQLIMPDTVITDACKGILQLPRLQELQVHSIELPEAAAAATPSAMCSQLTSLLLMSITSAAAHLLPLPELLGLTFSEAQKDASRRQLAAAIATQTALTRLEMMENGKDGFDDDDIITTLAPLKRLKTLHVAFMKDAPAASGSIRALEAIAALPELRDLTVAHMGNGQHLVLLHQCPQLQQLGIYDVARLQTSTLAGLLSLCGMRRVRVGKRETQGLDEQLLLAVAASVGVELIYQATGVWLAQAM